MSSAKSQRDYVAAIYNEEDRPYNDNTFDIIFSQSVLEQFYFPEELVMEVYRILKPNGLVITMIPDWESVYKTFYEDYTH